MRILIHSLLNETNYVVTSLRDCKTGLDQMAFEKAIRKKGPIQLREVMAVPLNQTKEIK